jgi:hypothetical protein
MEKNEKNKLRKIIRDHFGLTQYFASIYLFMGFPCKGRNQCFVLFRVMNFGIFGAPQKPKQKIIC